MLMDSVKKKVGLDCQLSESLEAIVLRIMETGSFVEPLAKEVATGEEV